MSDEGVHARNKRIAAGANLQGRLHGGHCSSLRVPRHPGLRLWSCHAACSQEYTIVRSSQRELVLGEVRCTRTGPGPRARVG